MREGEKMNEIKIMYLQENLIEEATKLLVDTFQQETFTSHVYNFSKKNTKNLFYRASLLKAKLYLKAGHDIVVALKGDCIVGIAIMKNDSKLPFKQTAKILFPTVVSLIPLITKIHFRRVLSIAKAMKHTQTIKKTYITLEALAVDANYQGQGIAKMLLNRVHEISENEYSGVYLFTADKRNQQIYEHFGYNTIEECKGGELTVYHMFLVFEEAN